MLKARSSYPLVFYRTADPRFGSDQSFPCIALWRDGWDDYGNKTLFVAYFYTAADDGRHIGPVKIAIAEDDFRPAVPSTSSELPSNGYSLGQSISYYRNLSSQLDSTQRRRYLRSMRDCVARPEYSAAFEKSRIWDVSLTRSSSAEHVLRRAGFYVGGRDFEEADPPVFGINFKVASGVSRVEIPFDFSNASGLPNRINVLVGRNGTGKTSILATLAFLLSPGKEMFSEESLSGVKKLSYLIGANGDKVDGNGPKLSQIIALSYNAFDRFPLPKAVNNKQATPSFRTRLNYKYCGLRNLAGNFDTDEMVTMWSNALTPVAEVERVEPLRKLLHNFLDNVIVNDLMDGDANGRKRSFKKLSAGQRLVVSLFADIIAFIEEGSILLIDEPETHMHPGLLSSMYVALSDLLVEYDSYAIIATHSPVVVQNVPSACVRYLQRVNGQLQIKPMPFECFGEDFGEIYRKLFG